MTSRTDRNWRTGTDSTFLNRFREVLVHSDLLDQRQMRLEPVGMLLGVLQELGGTRRARLRPARQRMFSSEVFR